MITALAGGVGAAKFLHGLAHIVDQNQITVISNTGDDIELWGLHISPDIDIVIYTLAGVVEERQGWGIKADTFDCLEMMRRYGEEDWFLLGDRDLATHLFRTRLLRQGRTLSEITRMMCARLGVAATVLPMSDQKFQTHIVTDRGTMHFQEYLVRRKAADTVRGVVFEGADTAQPAPGVLEAIRTAEKIILCPSNPIASLGTILSIKETRAALKQTGARIAAISPIVGGKTLKGPADKIMAGLNMPPSARAVAELYRDFVHVFVLDDLDACLRADIEAMGLRVVVTDTIMTDLDKKRALAETVLNALE